MGNCSGTHGANDMGFPGPFSVFLQYHNSSSVCCFQGSRVPLRLPRKEKNYVTPSWEAAVAGGPLCCRNVRRAGFDPDSGSSTPSVLIEVCSVRALNDN